MIPAVLPIPKIWSIFKQGVSLLYKIYPLFGIPEIRTILKPRECLVEGVSLLSVKLSVERELSHFEGELQSEKIPAVISIPKI